MLAAESPLVRGSASGANVCDGGQLEVRLRYREEFANCGTSMKYARLAWCRYLAHGTDVNFICAFEHQDAFTKPASPIASAAVPDVVVSEVRSASSSASPSDEGDWTMVTLAEIDEGKRVGVKCRLVYLKDLCSA